MAEGYTNEKKDSKQNGLVLDSQHPFPGLFSYREEHQAFFFGRETESEEIAQKLQHNKTSVLYGSTGIGKTSLLRAGVIPKLKESGFSPVYIRINFEDDKLRPVDQIRNYLICSAQEKNTKDNPVEPEKLSIKELLIEMIQKCDLKPVVIFDQFEELFSVGMHHDNTISRFISELNSLIHDTVKTNLPNQQNTSGMENGYHLLFAIKEDYLPQFDALKLSIPKSEDYRYHLLPFNFENAVNVITKPSKGLFSKKVAESIAKIIPASSQADIHQITPEQDNWMHKKIDPLLLNLCCYQLNAIRLEKQEKKITLELLADIKVKDLIIDYFNQNMQGIPEPALTAIEEKLLTSEGNRKMELLEELNAFPGVEPEHIQTLIRKKIIRKEIRLNNVVYVELVHDAIAPILKEKRDLRRQKEKELQEQHKLETELKNQKLKTRKNLVVAVSALLIVILVLAVAIYAVRKGKEAERERIEANVLRRIAEENQEQVLEQKEIIDNLFEKLGFVYGSVENQKGEGLFDVDIEIEGQTAKTDSNGYFLVEIPRKKLQTEYFILAAKENYQPWEGSIYPGREDELKIILEEEQKVQESKELVQADQLIEKSEYEQAFDLTLKAAESGEIAAYNKVGKMLMDGRGTEKNPEKAMKWYKKAAAKGDVDAQYNIGNIHFSGSGDLQDYQAAERWFRTAANKGNADAQNKLGYIYYKGEGKDVNYEEAFRWYKKAAQQGKPEALNYLGLIFYMGRGVERDYNRAFEFYKEAADKGLASAMNNLGVCYQLGNGTEKNLEEAVYWYKKAAELGSDASLQALNKMGIENE